MRTTTALAAVLSICMAVLGHTASADWTFDRLAGDNTVCWVAMDSAGLAHAMYQIPGNGYGCNCGTLRSFVRLGPGNLLEISSPSSPINAVRPSMAVDAQRNQYVVYEKEWAGQTSIIRYNYMGNNTWVREGPYDIPGMHGYWPKIVVGPSGNLHVVTAQGGFSHYAFHSGPNLATGWVGPLEHELSGWGDGPGIAADATDAGLVCVEVGPERAGDMYLLRYANGVLVSEQKVNSGTSPIGYRWPSLATDYSTGNTYILARGFETGDNMETWVRSASGVISGPTVIRARPSGGDFDCPTVAARGGMVRYMWRESPGPSGERFSSWWSDGASAPQLVLNGTGYTITPNNMVLDPNGYIYAGMAIWTPDWYGPCIVLQPNPNAVGGISGTVRDNLGNVLRGALVEAQATGRYYQATTDDSGVYQMTGVYPASYSVTASKLGYQPRTTNGVAVTANQTSVSDFVLPVAQGTFTGIVRDQYGTVVEGATVTATGPGAYSTTTNPSGVYTLSGVSLGNYSITATKFGYVGQTVAGSLSANGQTATRDLSMRLILIPDAKTATDQMKIELTRKPITAVFSSDGCIYIEEPNRSGGIRVTTGQTGLAVGDVVDITGTVGTRVVSGYASERVVSASAVTKLSSSMPIKPLAMNCRSVGGGTRPGIPGVKDGVGANNMGLLVKVAGKVTKVIGTYVFIDDGSKVENVSGSGSEIGVMVRCPSTPSVSVGDIVSAVGVTEGSIPMGWTTNRRYLRLRDMTNLRKLQ